MGSAILRSKNGQLEEPGDRMMFAGMGVDEGSQVQY